MSIFDAFRKLDEKKTTCGAVEYLIAGLGNPGKQYENTRHNAGFLAIDHLAETLGVKINRSKHQALVAEATFDGHRVLLMKPQTYMNSSGTAIAEAAKFYKIPAERVLVFCDDITQVPGKIRIRRSGSAGGHNGLKSIIAWLGTENFPRVRIGVGEKPTPEYDLANWVTGKIPEPDFKAISARFDDVADAARLILAGDLETAMSRHNG